MIWRDDDPNVYTDVCIFKQIHANFIKRGETHTVAVIMKNLWKNHALFYYLATAPNLVIGLHGWEHKDYSTLSLEECDDDIRLSIDYWKENATRMVGNAKPITTFFAPWNRESWSIRKACEQNGLKFCNVKNGEWEGETVKSFHWWSVDKPEDIFL